MPKKKVNKQKSTNSTLSYTGQVTIERVRSNTVVGKKVIKNSGCIPLFEFLANCLTIATVNNAENIQLFNNKPQYLNCFYCEDPVDNLEFTNQNIRGFIKQFNVSVVSNKSTCTNPSQQPDAYFQVDIKFLLQDNNFKTYNNNVTSKINVLTLGGSANIGKEDSQLPHAYIIIPQVEDYLSYQEGVNYIITWSLKLANTAS